MEIAGFLGKLKGEEKLEPKKFLALVLTDQVVQAAVWHVANAKTEVVSLGTPVEWDGNTATTSELVSAADATISVAIEGLTPEPTELVIGVSSSWTDKDGILGAKRELIKAVCQELELKALGFVVLTDSILRYLKMQEGTPATSILIQLTRSEIVLVLVRLGHIEATEILTRGEDLLSDIEEGIAHFPDNDHLPSRIIVECGQGNCEEIVQNLVRNDWSKKFNFLHLPKIESLPRDTLVRAVAVAGGAEVAKSIGLTLTLPTPAHEEPPAADLPEEPTAPAPEIVSAEELGFTVGGSLAASEVPATSTETVRALPKLPKINLPKFSLPRRLFALKPLKPAALLVLFGVGLLAFISFLIIWLLPKSTLALTFSTKPLEESVVITLSETASTLDSIASVVPVERTSVEVSGEKDLETTGKKTVGDPSTGKVTIYNRTSLTKTFVKGTTLTSGTLKFTLDSDVTVASKSAGSDYIDVPGKAVAAITAAQIGASGNLGADTEFTLAAFTKDSYVAKNDEGLTGGNSKEIQVVTQEDKNSLIKSLTADLLQKAKAQVESENSPEIGYYVLESGSQVVNETYSDKVGSEASMLTAKLTLKVAILRYKKSHVTELVGTALNQKIPAGYTRVGDLPLVELGSGTENKDGEITSTAKVTISLIPSLDEVALKNSLRGKNAQDVEQTLASLPSLVKADVKITPLWLPPRLKSMPRNPKNIQIVVTSSL